MLRITMMMSGTNKHFMAENLLINLTAPQIFLKKKSKKYSGVGGR